MDDLTADNDVVLASLGGAPVMAGVGEVEGYGLEARYSERKRGAPRQRSGSNHR